MLSYFLSYSLHSSIQDFIIMTSTIKTIHATTTTIIRNLYSSFSFFYFSSAISYSFYSFASSSRYFSNFSSASLYNYSYLWRSASASSAAILSFSAWICYSYSVLSEAILSNLAYSSGEIYLVSVGCHSFSIFSTSSLVYSITSVNI